MCDGHHEAADVALRRGRFHFEAWFYRCIEREAINSYRRSRARTAWVFDKATRVRDAEGMDPHNPRPAKREPEEEVTDHRERGPVEELETQTIFGAVRAALTPALTPEQNAWQLYSFRRRPRARSPMLWISKVQVLSRTSTIRFSGCTESCDS